MNMAEPQRQWRWQATISQKKYRELEREIHEEVNVHGDRTEPLAERIMKRICDTLSYDPAMKQYTPEGGRRQYEALKRTAQENGHKSVRAYKLALRQGSAASPPL